MLYYYYKSLKDDQFSLIPEPREGCWIHIEQATIDDLIQVAALIKEEYTELQDALDKYELPRMEKIDSNLILFVRYPVDQESGLYTTAMTIILTSHFFVTISPGACPLVSSFILRKTTQATSQRSKLLVALLLKVVQEFTAEIKKVRYNVLRQEKEFAHIDSDDITALTKSEEILNQYFSALSPFRVILETIISNKDSSLYEKDHEKIDDLLNSVKQSEDLLSIVLKSIRGLRESYQTIFTNNLSKTIKLLTGLTILFSIPTMIASIYGMNISLPLEHDTRAFIWIMIIILALSVVGIWYFKRKRWL